MSEGKEDSSDSGALVQLSVETGQFLQKLTGSTFNELDGLIGDWLRYHRMRLIIERLEGVKKMCRGAGIDEPEQVSLDTLAPWIEGASVEEEPNLQKMWDALLANAADSRNEGRGTHRSFVRILKQIEITERKVLEALYRIDGGESEEKDRGLAILGPYPDNEKIIQGIREIGLQEPPENRLELAKINLVRLGLCIRGRNFATLTGVEGNPPQPQEAPHTVHISDFGRAFYEACQPPESISESDTKD
jgi:hypothetical protein